MKNKRILLGMIGIMLTFVLALTGCAQPENPSADAKVTLTAIAGVTQPATGGSPVTAISATDQYTGTVTWTPADATFAASTSYTATITLTVKSGYTFSGVAANAFTVPGATTTTNGANSGVVTAVFPATAAAAPDFAISTDDSTANDVATLGLIGASVSSSAPGKATAEIAAGKIKITSVSAGTAIITVSAGANTATIQVTVADTGAITLGTPVKYVETSWAPQNVTVTPGAGKITISWSAVTDATGYEIYWSLNTNTNAPNTPNRVINSGTTTSVTYGATEGIVNGTKYNVWIKTKRSSGTSEFSTMAEGTPHAADAIPASPTQVTVASTSSGQLKITWTAVSWATDYKVFIGTTTSLPSASQKGGQITDIKYTTTDLLGDTMYYVWVYAHNAIGDSESPSDREYGQTLPTSSTALVGTTWANGGGTGNDKIIFAVNGRCAHHYLSDTGVSSADDWDYSYIAATKTLTLYNTDTVDDKWTATLSDTTTGSTFSAKWTDDGVTVIYTKTP
jgi:hypothetical protein